MATRDSYLRLILAGLAAVACSGVNSSAWAAKSAEDVQPQIASAGSSFVYIGMHGSDISLGHFDPRNGDLKIDGAVAMLERPTWTISNPFVPVLYSVDEIGNDGKSNGRVVAYAIDRKTGTLHKLNEVDAGGGGTTHLTFDRRTKTIFAANYGSGSVAAIPVLADGRLGPITSLVTDVGSGPHRRQSSPHAHATELDPSGRYLLVSDLGADRVFVYPFDPKSRALRLPQIGRETHYIAPAGNGPRHTTFSRNGKYLYLLNELSTDLVTLRWDSVSGKLTEFDRQSTGSAGFSGAKSVSELLESPDGRFLYVGNRGENSILVYELQPDSGKPVLIQRLPSAGTSPWSFAFDSSGKWLLVANESSGTIATFAVDRASGQLVDTGKRVSTPKPVSITFVTKP